MHDRTSPSDADEKLNRKDYERELTKCHVELVKLQEWVKSAGAKIGLCGQAPSDHPEFARFLVECGIDSISVTPDSFVAVKQAVAAAEADNQEKPDA